MFFGWVNMTLGTEFVRKSRAGIGPLQLGVVLVITIFHYFKAHSCYSLYANLNYNFGNMNLWIDRVHVYRYSLSCQPCHSYCWVNMRICQLDRSLMIGWRKNLLKPWNGVLCIHFRVCLSICLCVCSRATDHTFWPRNLFFGLNGLNDPWDTRKKHNFNFYAFYWHFKNFSLLTTSKFWVSSYWSQFFT